MNLYFQTDYGYFVNSPIDFSPVGNISLIFGSTQNISVTLVNTANNGPYILQPGYNFVLGLKEVGTYLSGAYLAYGSANQVPNTGVGNYAYSITGFNLYTTGISGLLAQNSSITLALQLEYDLNGSGVVESNPITCSINNSYINLDQTPFISGALAVYPAVNNIQTIGNLGVTYLGTNQTGLFQPSGNYVLASQTGTFVTTGESASFYPASNPSNFIPSGNIVAGANVTIASSGSNLVISASGGGGTLSLGPNGSGTVFDLSSNVLDLINPINASNGILVLDSNGAIPTPYFASGPITFESSAGSIDTTAGYNLVVYPLNTGDILMYDGLAVRAHPRDALISTTSNSLGTTTSISYKPNYHFLTSASYSNAMTGLRPNNPRIGQEVIFSFINGATTFTISGGSTICGTDPTSLVSGQSIAYKATSVTGSYVRLY